jgi:hypothetical protein
MAHNLFISRRIKSSNVTRRSLFFLLFLQRSISGMSCRRPNDEWISLPCCTAVARDGLSTSSFDFPSHSVCVVIVSKGFFQLKTGPKHGKTEREAKNLTPNSCQISRSPGRVREVGAIVCVPVNLLIQFPGFSNVSFSHKASLVSNNKAEKKQFHWNVFCDCARVTL